MAFTVSQHVVYNPNIETLSSPNERPYHLGRIIAQEGHYSAVYFPYSGFICNILYGSLAPLSDDIDLPDDEIPFEQALDAFNQRHPDSHLNNTSRPSSPIIDTDTDSDDNMAYMSDLDLD
jgi:hypothetical protein